MKRKDYQNLVDQIEPDAQLKEKVFTRLAEKKTNRPRSIVNYAMIAVAILVLGLVSWKLLIEQTVTTKNSSDQSNSYDQEAESIAEESAAGMAELNHNFPGMGQAINQLGYDLLSCLDSSENVCLSPLSISLAFGMATNGAVGQTKTQMENTLHLTNGDQEQYSKILASLASDQEKNLQFKLANGVWFQKGINLNNNFIVANQSFQAKIQSVDFENQQNEAIKKINNWVKENTNDKIDQIISQIDPDTRMVIANGLYFKGKFLTEFDPDLTTKKPFSGIDKQVDVEMMTNTSPYRYFENNQLQYVELPLGENGSYTLNIYLPKADQDIQTIIQTIKEEDVKMKATVQQVALQLPKFKVSHQINLNEVMKNLGMTNAFDARKADFSGITQDEELYISQAIHKTVFDVNEAGVEAGAATALMISPTALFDPITTMDCNKPFIYTIHHTSTNTNLFVGICNQL